MACAANYAWANRQIMMHLSSEIILRELGVGPRDLNMQLVYDVCHNIAKQEEHVIDGKRRLVCVHRKGATRSFPPGHAVLSDDYRRVGQPVIIPGDMGTASYVLVGTPNYTLFHGLIPSPHFPLSTLRAPPYGHTRMTRGRCDLPDLHRMKLSFTTFRRF